MRRWWSNSFLVRLPPHPQRLARSSMLARGAAGDRLVIESLPGLIGIRQFNRLTHEEQEDP